MQGFYHVMQTGVQSRQGRQNAEPRVHRSLCVVFVGDRKAKVNQKTIAQVLRDMALITPDGLSRRLLVGPHHHTQILWIEATGEVRGADQVTEHHGKLSTFGLWCLEYDMLRSGLEILRLTALRCCGILRRVRN
jgi:hypothetical protein